MIPGGSGHVGTIFARAFHSRGDEVIVLSRRPEQAPWRVVVWDGETLDAWSSEFEGADATLSKGGRAKVRIPIFLITTTC